MRARMAAIAVLLFPVLSSAQSAPAPQQAPAPLPVRRVVLYKTGIGYFEHQVRRSQMDHRPKKCRPGPRGFA